MDLQQDYRANFPFFKFLLNLCLAHLVTYYSFVYRFIENYHVCCSVFMLVEKRRLCLQVVKGITLIYGQIPWFLTNNCYFISSLANLMWMGFFVYYLSWFEVEGLSPNKSDSRKTHPLRCYLSQKQFFGLNWSINYFDSNLIVQLQLRS